MKAKLLSRVRLLATPWTAAHQAPPFMGLSRQEYWSGLPLPSPKGQLQKNILEFNNVKSSVFICEYIHIWAPLVAQMVKNLPTMQETLFNPWARNTGRLMLKGFPKLF